MNLKNRFLAIAAALVVALSFASGTHAGVVISSGPYDVGIEAAGTVVDFTSFIGFRRNSDGYDPVIPGSPRDSWGVSAGATSSFVDSGSDFGTFTSHVQVGGGATTTTTSTLAGVYTVVHEFTFAADNVVRVHTTVTNDSGVAQAMLYQRNVDLDIAPTLFAEFSSTDPIGPPVIDSSFFGFETADPLVPYGSSGAAGGVFGPGDLGAGIKIDLGVLGAGASTSFDYWYGSSLVGQSALDLKAQVAGLGASYIVTGNSSEGGSFNAGANSFVLGFGSGAAAVPEPASMTLLAAGAMGLAGYTLRRRKAVK